MKLLIDMNLSPQWVPFFAEHGIKAIHWSTVGDIAAPDSEILAFAKSGGFVVFTHDLDFGMLLASSAATAPSVLQIRSQDVLPSAIGDAVVRAIHASRLRLDEGALVTIDPIRQRIRMLPL